MKFLVPAVFWFAAAIPVVVVFYLRKRKRTVQLVSSTLLTTDSLSGFLDFIDPAVVILPRRFYRAVPS